MKQDLDHTYTLTLTVRNRPGVLVRCAQVLGRRGHNIESLHIQPQADPNVSLMTMRVNGSPGIVDQIIAQLAKLIDVLKVEKMESYHV